MLNATKTARLCGVAGATTMALLLTACSGSGSGGSTTSSATTGAALTTVNVWDPYPQYDDSSDWAKYLQTCAPQGVTLKRTAAAQADLLNSLTSAVKAGNPPDVIMLDNPAVPDAVTSGLVAPASETGMDTTGFDPNLAGPGVVDGVPYGVPIGVNTLGLYYNKEILDKAGVDPASLTSWDALNAALAKVKAAGFSGITFSGIAGEEGVFQFLPWFWGAGANLKEIGSDQAVAAGQLVGDWIGKGYAPKSAITDNQAASWQLFLTGKYAFAENGSWFAKAAADLKDFKAIAIPLPGTGAASAPVPTGAEFVLAPVQKDNAQAHYDVATKVVSCLVGKENQVTTAAKLGYFSASKDLRAQQIASDPVWAPWAASIDAAQGRTSDLGTAYTATSAAISQALQAALNAGGDPAKVKQAFQEAAQQVG